MSSTESIDVIVKMRALLARSENDFPWSSRSDQTAALTDIDEPIAEVRRVRLQNVILDASFAPSGPIQEASSSSGWAREFLTIGEWDDKATAAGRMLNT